MSTTRYVVLGNEPEVQQFDARSPEFTYTVSAFCLAIDAMETHEGKESMTDLALSWDQWANRGAFFAGDRQRAKAFASLFVNHIKRQSPLIVIDGNLRGHTVLGYHPRGTWEGTHDQFNPLGQAIRLSSTMITDMIRAAENSNTRDFVMFQFKIATVFLHECAGHMFITFLGHGDIVTPNETNILDWGAESGRYLEALLFGGTMGWYDDGSGDHQPGHPYILLQIGQIDRVRSIAVEKFINREFYFPLPTARRPENPTNLRQLGVSQQMVVAQSSSDRRMMARVEKYGLHGFKVANKEVRKVPHNMRLRLQAVR